MELTKHFEALKFMKDSVCFEVLGDDVVKYGILAMLYSYELRKCKRISRYFHRLLSAMDCNEKQDEEYWMSHLLRYYGNYGIWRRGWIDLSKGIFERLTNDEINQLKYFLLRYEHNNNNEGSIIPLDVNSLYLYNYNATAQQVNKKIRFTAAILRYDLYRPDIGNCIRELYLMNANVSDQHILQLSNALLSREQVSMLEILVLHSNQFITELHTELLFKAIGTKMPYLKTLDLSKTRCNDPICHIIYEFYKEYHEETSLQHINLENALITENGIKQLEAIIIDKLISKSMKWDFMIRAKSKLITCW